MSNGESSWTGWVEQTLDGAAPEWTSRGVPLCSEDSCKRYDGKRCRSLGWRPSRVCEPAVDEMASILSKRHP